MGKQIQICSTDKDNEAFCKFLSDNKCSFFQSFAKSKDELFIIDLKNDSFKVYIWNNEFEWEPTYGQTKTEDKFYYINNESNAPVVEFWKTNWNNFKPGRIYWSKYFLGNPEYDVENFENFYQTIVKWVKKNSKGITKEGNTNVYFLEDAWLKYNKNINSL